MKISQVVFITGSSSGIGMACAYFLVKHGFTVYAGSRTPEKLDRVHPNLHPIYSDITDLNQIEQSIARIYEKEKQLNVVINNAGYGLFSAVEDATEEQMINQFDINVFSMFRVCKACIPYMKHKPQSIIINMSSYLGKVSLPLFAFYNASKFAVEGLSDALRYELKESGIRVHTIMPGFIQTNFTQNHLVKNKDTFHAHSDYQNLATTLPKHVIQEIEQGSHPNIIAQAVLDMIHNTDAKPHVYVGSKENKILSMKTTLSDEDFDTRMQTYDIASWKSLFYNANHSRYTITTLLNSPSQNIKKVDISNGIVSFDVNLKNHKQKNIDIDYLDKMVTIIVMQKGILSVYDKEKDTSFTLEQEQVYLYVSSKQNLSLSIAKAKHTSFFILSISDFILKRYLTGNLNEPVDYLYNTLQHCISLKLINVLPLDALTLYLIEGIKETYKSMTMNSMIGENRTIELMLHRFSLLDIVDTKISKEDRRIAMQAKEILLEDFISPPKIERLAHLCTTNRTKLRESFKQVHKMGISEYIKKFRLEKANLLLRERTLTIGEISKAVGYAHQGHFTKLFFETYGVHPKTLLSQDC